MIIRYCKTHQKISYTSNRHLQHVFHPIIVFPIRPRPTLHMTLVSVTAANAFELPKDEDPVHGLSKDLGAHVKQSSNFTD